MNRRPAFRGPRALGVLAAVLVLGIVLPARGGAAPAQSWKVTVSPHVGLTDGQRVSINVQATAAVPVGRAEARLCRTGIDYQPAVGNRPAPDFEIGGANCPSLPISTSADVNAVDSAMDPGASLPGGQTFTFRVGTGVTTWDDFEGTPRTLTCDESHPCALVVQIRTIENGTIHWTPFVQKMEFLVSDPIAGCGGPAPGIVTSGGSDRLSDAWVNWTLDECRKGVTIGAASRGLFVGEGDSMLGYTDRKVDVAFTALGYHDDVGFVPADRGRRSSAVMPVALNATVIAIAGGTLNPDGKPVPYKDIKLTRDEAAALMSGGEVGVRPYFDAIFARNPELAAWGFFAGINFQVGAAATSEATSWIGTRHFDTVAPTAWRVPDSGAFAPDNGRDRGIDASLALADPSFNNALTLQTGRGAMRKSLNGVAAPGGAWILTDRETARALGLSVAKIENEAGEFVEPTDEAMRAAVGTMQKDPSGILVPNPTATTAGGGAFAGAGATGATPYPLTFVEYALAPTEPLVDESTCTLRTDSQILLNKWLAYVTADGQAELPDGMLPVPDTMRAEATAGLATVGTAEVTGPCAGKIVSPVVDPPPADPPPPDAGGFDTGGGFGGGDFGGGDLGSTGAVSGSSGGGAGAGGVGAASTPSGGAEPSTKPDDPTKVELAAAQADLPGFGGAGASNLVITVGALLGIVLLTSVAASYSARRSGVGRSE